MSFSKAKIQRFNDVKVPIGTIRPACDKTKPTTKPHDGSSAKSDTGSSQSVPCFRPPTLIRKKQKTTNPAPKPNPKPAENLTTDQTLEALKEKIVECDNKDAYIKELVQQLEEIKEKIGRVECASSQIDNETNKYEEIVENLKNEHENRIKIIQEEFKLRLCDTVALKDQLKQQLEQLRCVVEAHTKEMEVMKTSCNELPSYVRNLDEDYRILLRQKQQEIDEKAHLLKNLEQSSIDMQKQHSLEIERLRKEQQIEMQDLEFEMLKTMTELQREKEICTTRIEDMERQMTEKINEMKNVFETEKVKIIQESQEKINQLEETIQNNLTDEDLLQEKLAEQENEWKAKLAEQRKQSDAILKECQAISEYNIIQCEIEKNSISKELKENIEELKTIRTNYDAALQNFKTLKDTYEQLKTDVDAQKLELDDQKRELLDQIQSYQLQLQRAQKEKSTYEFTIQNSQITIDVLKNRLMNSDKDVEQLKEELAECEKKLLKYEQKNLELESDLLHTRLVNDELEMQFESTIKLNCQDIEDVSQKLLKDVSDYKKEVVKYKVLVEEEKGLKDEIMEQLHDVYEILGRLKTEYENAEAECSEYKFEAEQSQNELEDYRLREMDWNIIRDKLELTIRDLEELVERKMKEIAALKKEIEQVKEKSDTHSQSEQYYRQKVNELESDQKETENIHKKYIEMSGKYDVLVWKYEELENENLQNKMKLMKLSDDQTEKENLKSKYDNQVSICNELEATNSKLKAEIETKSLEESSLKEEIQKIKAERDALLNKVCQLEIELKQGYIEQDGKQRTPKKTKKLKDEENYADPKTWLKKSKHSVHPVEDKENLNSPTRTINSNRIESPLRDRN